jgi:hypothetical protein
MTFTFEQLILPGDAPSMVPDVAISPDGRRFALAALTANELQVFDLQTRRRLRRITNPGAQLDHPHGLAMTDRYLVVGNKMDPEDRPALLQVFDLDAQDNSPVCSVVTPLPYLREAHSMALHGDRLLVTYAGTGKRALVCYHFDPVTGQIGAMLDSSEEWFTRYGTPKGVCFNHAGDRAIVTFVSARRIPSTTRQRLGRALWILRQPQGARRLAERLRVKVGELLTRGKMSAGEHATRENGIALFTIGADGSVSREPAELQLESGYTRLENIHSAGQRCVVVDPMRGEVRVGRIAASGLPDPAQEIIRERVSFPHCGRLTPDGRTLLVANNGLRVENDKPQWHQFTAQRSDGVSVFRLEASR